MNNNELYTSQKNHSLNRVVSHCKTYSQNLGPKTSKINFEISYLFKCLRGLRLIYFILRKVRDIDTTEVSK